MIPAPRNLLGAFLILAVTSPAMAQFVDTFDDLLLEGSRSGNDGWSFFTGDGEATMDFVALDEGTATILVDATSDHRNIWWALVKRKVSDNLDLAKLSRPAWELRIEARVRTSHAPRRVNLHVNTQRTTDFHSHLTEFDIPVSGVWHTLSMTTSDFPVEPGDQVFAQMALMDWGGDAYRVDIDVFRVDVVEAAAVDTDSPLAVPYHPPIPDPAVFDHAIVPSETAVVDLANPTVNLGRWSVLGDGVSRRTLTVNPAMWVILRWDLEAVKGRRVSGHGLLELTTHSVQRNLGEGADTGLVRIVEILRGDPFWQESTVTLGGLLQNEPVDEVFNPQMIIDQPVNETAGGVTRFTISRPVLQRMIDGTTRGLAIKPLGPINATFLSQGPDSPRLRFNIDQ